MIQVRRKVWAGPIQHGQTADWKTMNLPTAWEQAGLPDFDGVVWFRKEFDLPESAAGQDGTLSLGPVDDIDTTWVNGVRVGGMSTWTDPRVYKVPGRVLKAGRNVVAVRVLDTGGAGGIYGQADQLRFEPGGAASRFRWPDPGSTRPALAGPDQAGAPAVG